MCPLHVSFDFSFLLVHPVKGHFCKADDEDHVQVTKHASSISKRQRLLNFISRMEGNGYFRSIRRFTYSGWLAFNIGSVFGRSRFECRRTSLHISVVEDTVDDGRPLFRDGGWISEGKCSSTHRSIHKIVVHSFLTVSIHLKPPKSFVSLYWWIITSQMVLCDVPSFISTRSYTILCRLA